MIALAGQQLAPLEGLLSVPACMRPGSLTIVHNQSCNEGLQGLHATEAYARQGLGAACCAELLHAHVQAHKMHTML